MKTTDLSVVFYVGFAKPPPYKIGGCAFGGLKQFVAGDLRSPLQKEDESSPLNLPRRSHPTRKRKNG